MSDSVEAAIQRAAASATATGLTTPIVIREDRSIVVPTALQQIAVQCDNEANVLHFECPRNWADIDLAAATLYINVVKPDKSIVAVACTNIVSGEDTVTFDWVVTEPVTGVAGKLSFLVCARDPSDPGDGYRWHSNLCDSLFVAPGIVCTVPSDTPDPPHIPLYGTDPTLTRSGVPADAAAVGKALSSLSEEIANLPSGGGGTTDYTALSNKPQINGVELSGDKTSEDLGIGNPTDVQVASAVETWLDEHPEATTTVEDGSITEQKLADGAVTEPKAGFLHFDGYSENLFNKKTATDGYRTETYGDVLKEADGYSVSNYIPVEAGATYKYTYTASRRVQFFDSSKTFISGTVAYNGSFVTPDSCAYIRIELATSEKDVFMVVEGDSLPSEYVNYAEYYTINGSIRITVDNIKDLVDLFNMAPDHSIPDSALSESMREKIGGVDNRVNTAAGWNDANQPRRTLSGRINVFEHAAKGVLNIISDISEQVVVVHGVNYFNVNDMIPGKIETNTGEIKESTGGCYSEHLIPVTPGKKLYYNRNYSLKDGYSYIIVHCYDKDGAWIRYKLIAKGYSGKITLDDDVYYIRLYTEDKESDALIEEQLCIADIDIGSTYYGYGSTMPIDGGEGELYFGKTLFFPYIGYRIENGILIGASDKYTVEEFMHVDVFDSASTIEVTAPVEAFDQNKLKNVSLKYGRHGGTDYVMARIFKNTVDGGSITPKVIASTPGGITMKNYASENDFVFAINAGIFNTDDNSCLGTTISDGVVITDHVTPNLSGAGDTLGVDSNGDFVSVDYDTTTEDMLANGITQAVQGWATIISNYAKSDLDALKETLYPSDGTYGTDYIVTAKHPRTACGQYANGDYMVFLCGGRQTNQEGMTLAEMQELFVAEGVKYAYNLDGGGSCNGYFYKKETAPYTEGRADPSYIVFN